MSTKLGDILGGKFSRKDDLSRQIAIVRVFDIYREEVAKQFSSQVSVRPVSLRHKVLTVSAGSSVLASELRMREGEVVKEINKQLEKEIVKRVIYRF